MHGRTIAYFSMEIALRASMPTYAGGLGVLAGDHMRAAADARLPLVGVTLLHAGGHFRQRLGPDGQQIEERAPWRPEDHMVRLPQRVTVGLEGRPVQVGAWRFEVAGVGPGEGEAEGIHADHGVWSGGAAAGAAGSSARGDGGRGPHGGAVVILLDTDLPENAEQDRSITDRLYLGDQRDRLLQEAVLGIGGARMLEALGYDVATFHMNEGHAALLTLELLRLEAERQGRAPTEGAVVEQVRRRCVFTTHTPVEAGHDRFPLDLVRQALEPALIDPYRGTDKVELVAPGRMLNMTFLGFNLSKYINGVSRPHGRVSRAMFGGWPIQSITNGVHAPTWVAPPMARVLDKRTPGWRQDKLSLRSVVAAPLEEIWAAHQESKRALCEMVKKLGVGGSGGGAGGGGGAELREDVFTIGFARRATAYKRADLLLAEPERLRAIARAHGGLQIVYAGKAHPYDKDGAELIRKIVAGLRELAPDVTGVYLPDYDMNLARVLVCGVDLWLNTPLPPLEASGTSGMKAAMNGVPSLSTIDGWWVEGWLEGVTGWAIGDAPDADAVPRTLSAGELADRRASDAESIYEKLEQAILPLYSGAGEAGAGGRDGWVRVMRSSIALNGSFFNAQRMLAEYAMKAYFV